MATTAHLPRLRHLFDVPLADYKVRPVIDVTPVSASVPVQHSPRPGRQPKAEIDILRCVQANPGITIPEILAATGYSRPHTQIVLNRLLQAKAVRRSGHKPGSPAQWWIL